MSENELNGDDRARARVQHRRCFPSCSRRLCCLARSSLADDVTLRYHVPRCQELPPSDRAATEHGPPGPRAVSWFGSDGQMTYRARWIRAGAAGVLIPIEAISAAHGINGINGMRSPG